MKIKSLYLVIIIITAFFKISYGSTDKSGLINNHQEWSDTIKVVGDITVGENGELIINPGTYIEFQGFFSITVNKNGRLIANGSLNDSIVFIPKNKQTGWNGILFKDLNSDADSSFFNYCNIQYCNRTDYYLYGSAFHVKKFDRLRISNSKIMNCKDNHSKGAGFYADSSNIVIRNTYFGYNDSGYGGGAYFSNSNPTIENSTFDHNTCNFWGAGMYFIKSNPKINNCIITNNRIGSSGGEAVYFEESVGEILNSKIINNSNVGIYCYHANISIINTVVANNNGAEVGGIYLVNSHPNIINCTVVNNFGYTVGGIYCYYYSKPNIKNSIIWNNHGKYNEIGLGEYLPIITYCDIKNGNNLKLPAANYLNCINKDPKFKLPILDIGNSSKALGADWSLKSCSPCINMGNNSDFPSAITVDYSGFPRIYDNIVDIGAHESQLVEAVSAGRMIVYVKPGGLGNGTSWNDALGNLTKAIDIQTGCFEGIDLWLATGTYYPDTLNLTDKRSASFILKDNVRIYGGFKGDETSLDQRNYEINTSILSGNIGNKSLATDNLYHVISANYVDSSAILDGLTISGGFATDSVVSCGGGIKCNFASPTFNNVQVANNYAQSQGGGIFLNYSNPYIGNTKFYNNTCDGYGGCGYLNYSNPVIYNTQIINNGTTYRIYGGGLYLLNSNPRLINTIIANNGAGYSDNGGGIYCQASNPQIINSVIANNLSKSSGGGIYCSYESRPLIYNSIFWNNQDSKGINHFAAFSGLTISIKNSIVQGGNKYNISSMDYQNNMDANPGFILPSIYVGISNDALTASWNISSCSPAIDAGNNSLLPTTYKKDLSGNNRINNNNIDIGPYEFQGIKSQVFEKQIIYVKQGATGDGSSWNSALGNLQQAIAFSKGCYKTNEIWVAKGVYKPDIAGLQEQNQATFKMLNDVKVYGGFIGNENSLSARNFEKNITTLSGDIGVTGNITDNCYHVVTFDKTDTTSILDGFYVENGNATKLFDDVDGGGIYCKYSNLKLSNIIAQNNNAKYDGGGMRFYNSNVQINNVRINNNKSEYSSAGISFKNSTFSLTNSKICNNDCNSYGGIHIFESKGKIFNCLISNNYGGDNGGICSYRSNYTLVNSSIINNKAFRSQGDLGLHNDTVLVLNCIFWNNDNPIAKNKDVGKNLNFTIKNSDIQYGSFIELPIANYINNIDIEPYFNYPIKTVGVSENALKADWSIKRCSPCINKGLNDKNYIFSNTDIIGNPRLFNNDTIDLGPYEVQFMSATRPTDISLSNNIVYYNNFLNSPIGKLSAKDSDSNSFKFSFSSSEIQWSNDSSYFKIDADGLFTNYAFDANMRSEYSITIKVTDDQGCDLDKPFNISVLKPLGIESDLLEAGIQIFPNPTNKFLNLKFNQQFLNNITINLYDMNGKILMNKSGKTSDNWTFDLGSFNKGNYILQIDSKSKKYKQLIILE